MVESTKKSDDELDIREFAPEKSPISTEAVDASELIAQIEAEVQRAIRDAGGDDSKLVADLKTLQREAGSAKSSRDLSNVRQSLFLQTMNTRSDAAKVRTEEAVKETQGGNLSEEYANDSRARYFARMNDITDATRASWLHSFTDPTDSPAHRKFLTDLGLLSSDPIQEAQYNATSQEARVIANSVVEQQLKLEAKYEAEISKMYATDEYHPGAYSFLLKLKNSGHYGSENMEKWLEMIRSGNEIPHSAWTELDTELREKSAMWTRSRHAAIDAISKLAPEEAALARKLDTVTDQIYVSNIYTKSKEFEALSTDDKERLNKLRDEYHEIKDPKARADYWEKLGADQKTGVDIQTYIAVMDVTQATRMNTMKDKFVEKAVEINTALTKMKDMTPQQIEADPYLKALNEIRSGADDVETQYNKMLDYAISNDKLLSKLGAKYGDDFNAAKRKFVEETAKQRAGAIASGDMLAYASTFVKPEFPPELQKAELQIHKSVAEGKFNQESIRIMNTVDQNTQVKVALDMHDAEQVAKTLLKQHPKDGYTHTLSRLVAHGDALSKDAIKLIEDIRDGEVSKDDAWKRWEQVYKKDYKEVAAQVRPEVAKALKEMSPAMEKAFNTIPQEELIVVIDKIKDPRNHALYEEAKDKMNDLMLGRSGKVNDANWAKLSTNDKKLVLAFAYADGLHVGEYGLCHATACVKPSTEKEKEIDALNKNNSIPSALFGANGFGAYNIPNVNTQKPAAEPTFDAALKQVKPDAATKSVFDLNHDQKLDINEVRKVMGQMGIKLDNFDKNHDHQLTAPELTAAMQAAVQQANSGKKPGKTP